MNIYEWVNINNIKNAIISGGQITVNGSVRLSDKSFKSLEHKFETVNGSFHIENNKLTDFKNFPTTINGSLRAEGNNFLDVTGFPAVNGSAHISGHLTEKQLEGISKKVNGSLYFNGKKVTNKNYDNQSISITNGSVIVNGIDVTKIFEGRNDFGSNIVTSNGNVFVGGKRVDNAIFGSDDLMEKKHLNKKINLQNETENKNIKEYSKILNILKNLKDERLKNKIDIILKSQAFCDKNNIATEFNEDTIVSCLNIFKNQEELELLFKNDTSLQTKIIKQQTMELLDKIEQNIKTEINNFNDKSLSHTQIIKKRFD